MVDLENKIITTVTKVVDEEYEIDDDNVICFDISNHRIGIGTKNPTEAITICGGNIRCDTLKATDIHVGKNTIYIVDTDGQYRFDDISHAIYDLQHLPSWAGINSDFIELSGNHYILDNSHVSLRGEFNELSDNYYEFLKGDVSATYIVSERATIANVQIISGNIILDSNISDTDNDKIAVNRGYVDSVIEGLNAKKSVRYATQKNNTNSDFSAIYQFNSDLHSYTRDTSYHIYTGLIVNAYENIDPSASDLSINDRILIKNQTDKTLNGVYEISRNNMAITIHDVPIDISYLLTRTSDFDENSEIHGAYVFVQHGTSKNMGYVQSSDNSMTKIGIGDLEFVIFNRLEDIHEGSGIDIIDEKINIKYDPDEFAIDLNNRFNLKDGGIQGSKIDSSANVTLNHLTVNSISVGALTELGTVTGITPSMIGLSYEDGSGIFTELTANYINILQTPTHKEHVATKEYVDNNAHGLNIKDHVNLVSADSDISLIGVGFKIDATDVSVNDRVLVIKQSNLWENGVYDVSVGVWSRSGDFDSSANIKFGSYFFVDSGINYRNTSWVLADLSDINFNDNNISGEINFSKFSAVGNLYPAENGGLINAGHEWSISGGGVTNDMLAGGISGGKIDPYTNIVIQELSAQTIKTLSVDTSSISTTSISVANNISVTNNISASTMTGLSSLHSQSISSEDICANTIRTVAAYVTNLYSTNEISGNRINAQDISVANHIHAGSISTQSTISTYVDASHIFVGGHYNESYVEISNGNIILYGTVPQEQNAHYAVKRAYVDSEIEGLHAKKSVRYATYQNIGTSGVNLTVNSQTDIDISAIDLSSGDRILVKNQSSNKDNGIYEFNSDNTLTRTSDFSNGMEIHGSYIFVKHGKSKDMGYVVSSDLSRVVVGDNSINFVIFNRLEDIHEGNAIDIIDEKINVNFNDSIFGIQELNKLTIIPGGISNNLLAHSLISLGGVSVSLGESYPTPAFNLTSATHYPAANISGQIQGHQIDSNNDIFNQTSDKLDIKVGGISNELLLHSAITLGGVDISLGDSILYPTFDLSNAYNYPAASISGLIDGYQINPSADISAQSLTVHTIDVSNVVGLTANMVQLGDVSNISYEEIQSNIYAGIKFNGSNEFNSISLIGSSINSTSIGMVNPSDASFTTLTANSIILQSTPTLSAHAATKQYVDNNSQGLAIKDHVQLATTYDISNHVQDGKIIGQFQIDGNDISDGYRILVKDQKNKWENGVYIVNRLQGGWTRSTDFDNSSNMVFGSYFFVDDGWDNINTSWVLTDTSDIIFNENSISGEVNFSKFSATNNLHVDQQGGLYKDGHLIGITPGGVTNDMLAGDISGSKINPASDMSINRLHVTTQIVTNDISAHDISTNSLYSESGHISTINSSSIINTSSIDSSYISTSSLDASYVHSSSIVNTGHIDTLSIAIANDISAANMDISQTLNAGNIVVSSQISTPIAHITNLYSTQEICGNSIRATSINTSSINVTNNIDASDINVTNKIDAERGYIGDVEISGGHVLLQHDSIPQTHNGRYAVHRSYVDSVIEGLHPKKSVLYSTNQNSVIQTIYKHTVNGTHHISKKYSTEYYGLIINNSIDIDPSCTALSLNSRILINNSPGDSSLNNGIYDISAVNGSFNDGDISYSHFLTRVHDFKKDMKVHGSYVFVQHGKYKDTGFVLSSDNSMVIVGQDAINFVKFNKVEDFHAGDGIIINNEIINVNYQSNIFEIDSDTKQLGITSGGINNTKLQYSSITLGGVDISLGNSIPYPVFDLSNAYNYPAASISGLIDGNQINPNTNINIHSLTAHSIDVSTINVHGDVSGLTKRMVGLENVEDISFGVIQSRIYEELSYNPTSKTYSNITSDYITSDYITIHNTPTEPHHATTKQYVDGHNQGIYIKTHVRLATTENVDLNSTGTIDTISVSIGDRILVKNQDINSENGVYNANENDWTRVEDFDNSTNMVKGSYFFVDDGYDNINTSWVFMVEPSNLQFGDNLSRGVSGDIIFSKFSAVGNIHVDPPGGLYKDGHLIGISHEGVTNDMLAGDIEGGKINPASDMSINRLHVTTQIVTNDISAHDISTNTLYSESGHISTINSSSIINTSSIDSSSISVTNNISASTMTGLSSLHSRGISSEDICANTIEAMVAYVTNLYSINEISGNNINAQDISVANHIQAGSVTVDNHIQAGSVTVDNHIQASDANIGNVEISDGYVILQHDTIPETHDGRNVVHRKYVDSVVEGLHAKQSVRFSTSPESGNYPNTYVIPRGDGTSETRIFLTHDETIDLSMNGEILHDERVLINHQDISSHNGIYTINSVEVNNYWKYELHRSSDFMNGMDVHGAYVFVQHGKYKDTGFVLSSDLSKIIVGQDPIKFVKFNKVEDFHGGEGIRVENEIINVRYDQAVFNTSNPDKILKISENSITNQHLANSSITLGGVGISLGGTDSTPTFNLSNAYNYPAASISGKVQGSQIDPATNIDISSLSAHSIDVSTINVSGNVTGLTKRMVGLGNVEDMSFEDIKNRVLGLDTDVPKYAANFSNITLSESPQDSMHAATKQYVDNNSQGLAIKDHVRFATTSNISGDHIENGIIKSIFQIDGNDISDNDRILVKDQINKWENGVWLASHGNWTRSTDFDNSTNMVFGSYFFVDDGWDNINTSWVLKDTSDIIFDDNSISGEVNFSKFSATNNLHVDPPGGLYKDGHLIGISHEGVTNDMLAGDISGSKINPASNMSINRLHVTTQIETHDISAHDISTNTLYSESGHISTIYSSSIINTSIDTSSISTSSIDASSIKTVSIDTSSIDTSSISTSSITVTNNISASTMTGLSSLYSQGISSEDICANKIWTVNAHVTNLYSTNEISGINIDASFIHARSIHASDATIGNVIISDGNVLLSNDDIPETQNGRYAVHRSYVDSVVEGLHAKQSVRYATYQNIDTSGDNLTVTSQTDIDISAIDLSSSDRILVKNQASNKENGIYEFNSNNTLTRTSDFSNGMEIHGSYIFVKHGKSKDMGYVVSSDLSRVVVGDNSINFVIFNRLEDIHEGSGIDITDEKISVKYKSDIFTINSSKELDIKSDGIENSKLQHSSITLGGVDIFLGGTNSTPAFDLTDASNYPTHRLSGKVQGSQIDSTTDINISSLTAHSIDVSTINVHGDVSGLTKRMVGLENVEDISFGVIQSRIYEELSYNPTSNTYSNITSDHITINNTPTEPHHATTKQYVDGHNQGIYIKTHVRLATTENVHLNGLDIIDNISVAIGDRILVKNQNINSENGVYEAKDSNWTRVEDFDNSTNMVKGSYFFVDDGYDNINTSWVFMVEPSNLQFDGNNIISDIIFSKFSAVGNIHPDDGGGLYKHGHMLGISHEGVTNDMLQESSITGDKINPTSNITINSLTINSLTDTSYIFTDSLYVLNNIHALGTQFTIDGVSRLTSQSISSEDISANTIWTENAHVRNLYSINEISGNSINAQDISVTNHIQTGSVTVDNNIQAGSVTVENHIQASDATIGNVEISNGNILLYNDDIPETQNGRYAVHRSYVDSVVEGLHAKKSVRYATYKNISGDNGILTVTNQTDIDISATLSSGRILVKNQLSNKDNGIYDLSNNRLTRTSDFSKGHEIHGSYVFVKHGTSKDMGYVVSSDLSRVVVGDNSINFVIFNRLEDIHEGSGIDITDEKISVKYNSEIFSLTSLKELDIKSGGIENTKLLHSNITLGGVDISLGGTDSTPAFDLTDAFNYPAENISGLIGGSQIDQNTDINIRSFTAHSIDVSTINVHGDVSGLTKRMVGLEDVSNMNFDAIKAGIKSDIYSEMSYDKNTSIFSDIDISNSNINISSSAASSFPRGLINTQIGGSGGNDAADAWFYNVNVNEMYVNNMPHNASPQHVATKNYVDSKANGLHIKEHVQLASIFDIGLHEHSTIVSSIDGQSVIKGYRILLKDQDISSENGVYDVVGDNDQPYQWQRNSNFDNSSNMIKGSYFHVESGTINAGSSWVLTADVSNLDTSPVNFTLFSKTGVINAGDGLTKSIVNGNTELSISGGAISTDMLQSGSVTGDKIATNSDIYCSELHAASRALCYTLIVGGTSWFYNTCYFHGHDLSNVGNIQARHIFTTDITSDTITSGTITCNEAFNSHSAFIGKSDGSYVDISNGTIKMNGTIPQEDNGDYVANRGYVDSEIEGLHAKKSVSYATSGNLTPLYFNNTFGYTEHNFMPTHKYNCLFLYLFTDLDSDAYNLSEGMRILVKDQDDSHQNGIYEISTNVTLKTWKANVYSSYNWNYPFLLTRAPDFSNGHEVHGSYVFVKHGKSKDMGYVVSSDLSRVVVGESQFDFFIFNRLEDIHAGDGIRIENEIINVNYNNDIFEIFSESKELNIKTGGITNDRILNHTITGDKINSSADLQINSLSTGQVTLDSLSFRSTTATDRLLICHSTGEIVQSDISITDDILQGRITNANHADNVTLTRELGNKSGSILFTDWTGSRSGAEHYEDASGIYYNDNFAYNPSVLGGEGALFVKNIGQRESSPDTWVDNIFVLNINANPNKENSNSSEVGNLWVNNIGDTSNPVSNLWVNNIGEESNSVSNLWIDTIHVTNSITCDISGNATTATRAENANTATYATTAGSVGYATTAGSATTATRAENANTATYATTAGSVGYATTAGSATTADQVKIHTDDLNTTRYVLFADNHDYDGTSGDLHANDGITYNSTNQALTIGQTDPSQVVIQDGTIKLYGTIPQEDNGDYAVKKAYVDSEIEGLHAKKSVRYATYQNINGTDGNLHVNYSSEIDISATNLSRGDRILVKDQNSKQYNGIYEFSGNILTRAPDFSNGHEVHGSYVFVKHGKSKDMGYVVSSDLSRVVVGESQFDFFIFNRLEDIHAGQGIRIENEIINVDFDTAFFNIDNGQLGIKEYSITSNKINQSLTISSLESNTVIINDSIGNEWRRVPTLYVNQIGEGWGWDDDTGWGAVQAIFVQQLDCTQGQGKITARQIGDSDEPISDGTFTSLTVTNTISGSINGNAATAGQVHIYPKDTGNHDCRILFVDSGTGIRTLYKDDTFKYNTRGCLYVTNIGDEGNNITSVWVHDITVTHNLKVGSGADIHTTGVIGGSAHRVNKLWVNDIDAANTIHGDISGNAETVTINQTSGQELSSPIIFKDTQTGKLNMEPDNLNYNSSIQTLNVLKLVVSGGHLKLDNLKYFFPMHGHGLNDNWSGGGGDLWGGWPQWGDNMWTTHVGSQTDEAFGEVKLPPHEWRVSPLMIQVHSADNEWYNRVGIYRYNSDRRLKTNIKGFNRKLDIVKKMNPVYFTWKDSSSNDYGFIAQELEVLMPGIIRDETDDNGETVKTYDYCAPTHLIAVLTKAIQDLDEDKNKEIEELKNRILALEGENVTLKNQMNDVLTRLSAAGL